MILSCLILDISASGVSQRVAIPGLQGGAKGRGLMVPVHGLGDGYGRTR
jgi:hypothetical protein